jgi:acyl-CoA hydrolase
LSQYVIGLRIASLIKDGGSLQIGIGAVADGVVWSLILRHSNNAAFRGIAARLGITDGADLAPFEEGLYGVSEMFVDVFLDLYRAGILKRRAADGALLHAAFFLGPQSFYKTLREIPEAERQAFHMKPISFTNRLASADVATRRQARFVNEGMTATLLGEISSDTLDNGLVVSGVGGQYNFVAQAHDLPDARSIIAIAATRTANGRTTSNIRWTGGHVTIPRHLRDIVVTEYGIADLRAKSDRDCIAAMLEIADTRFQPDLLAAAKAVGKIEPAYSIPAAFSRNYPADLEAKLLPAKHAGLLPAYPFGTDLDAVEQRLAAALERLKRAPGGRLAVAYRLLKSLFAGHSENADQALRRVGLLPARSLGEAALARVLNATLLELEAEDRFSAGKIGSTGGI